MTFLLLAVSDEEEEDDEEEEEEEEEQQNQYATISPPPEYAPPSPKTFASVAGAPNDSWAESEPSEADEVRKKVSSFGTNYLLSGVDCIS